MGAGYAVRSRTLVRTHPGAGGGRLQHCRSLAGEQGHREHPTLARTLLPIGAVEDSRARAVLEERRQPPRLFAYDPPHVLHRRRRGGRVQGTSQQRDAGAPGYIPESARWARGEGTSIFCSFLRGTTTTKAEKTYG